MKEIVDLGQSQSTTMILSARREFSQGRLIGIQSSLEKADSARRFNKLAIYVAGSFGRMEASPHSDIDLFFVSSAPREEYEEIRIPEIRLLSEVITIGDRLAFPKFSNDGEFLRFLYADEMLDNLGSRSDDMYNHFTARMLLLLESRPVFGNKVFNSILNQTIDSYFRDYPHHPTDFKPTFMINDILRFWKTLCLNYEHRRNQVTDRQKIKQKVKNFKLKYSRLMTCFATVASLCTFRETISPAEVAEICSETPVERMLSLAARCPQYGQKIAQILDSYAWFIEMTGKTTEELDSHFVDKNMKQMAFRKADAFGKIMSRSVV